MSRTPALKSTRAVALCGSLLVASLLCPGTALAAPFTCEASALRGSLGPAPPVEPVTANRGAASCRSQTAGANTPAGLPAGLAASGVFARTTATGAESQPALQRVSATGGLAATRGRGVTVSGRITRPLARPLQTVVVTRRVSCGRVEVVKRFKPSRSGRFRVNLPAAKRRQVAVFRFRTLVRHNASDPKLYRTFTLPRYVDIG